MKAAEGHPSVPKPLDHITCFIFRVRAANPTLASWSLLFSICLTSLFSRRPFFSPGLDSARVRQAGQIAGQSSTRRLGDYRVKINYNDIDLLR